MISSLSAAPPPKTSYTNNNFIPPCFVFFLTFPPSAFIPQQQKYPVRKIEEDIMRSSMSFPGRGTGKGVIPELREVVILPFPTLPIPHVRKASRCGICRSNRLSPAASNIGVFTETPAEMPSTLFTVTRECAPESMRNSFRLLGGTYVTVKKEIAESRARFLTSYFFVSSDGRSAYLII
ncbi:hypothetical protein OUZ56_007664 [Daphnia magna]|uniref:Uncharacterized protein n=1 Tax=Daphnia magna TaxID=35525 RepID=A0ABR0AAS1_9CRUS|nr:hypothetical protein OUZ56_007664 [Daphnia magna]